MIYDYYLVKILTDLVYGTQLANSVHIYSVLWKKFSC